jgi:hypothetical protein
MHTHMSTRHHLNRTQARRHSKHRMQTTLHLSRTRENGQIQAQRKTIRATNPASSNQSWSGQMAMGTYCRQLAPSASAPLKAGWISGAACTRAHAVNHTLAEMHATYLQTVVIRSAVATKKAHVNFTHHPRPCASGPSFHQTPLV